MTDFKVEYRGFPVPQNYLNGATLLGPTLLSAWKRGVDDVLDSSTEPEDKTEYFVARDTNGADYYRIAEGAAEDRETVDKRTTDGYLLVKWITPKYLRSRAVYTPISRDQVPADFRLGGNK